jgi:glycopeptide antibiotics resistance protein
VIVLMGIGLELSQALSNILVSPIPPYRIDIHDVLVRSLGALVTYAGFSFIAALYRWKVPAQRQRYGIAGFVDALIRRI